MSEISLDNLPIEILHRIFDHLDVCTIIGSVRGVSKQFYVIVNSYDRFQISFRSNKKSFVEGMSHLIQPSNVTSLVLPNSYNHTCKIYPSKRTASSISTYDVRNLIELFLKTFDINKFIRLRSLILYKLNDDEIQQILQNINIDSLVSLAIDTRKPSNDTILSIVFPFIVRINLQKLHLIDLDYRDNGLSWPRESRLTHLTIRDCDYHGYHLILSNLHHLKTLVIRFCIMNASDEPISPFKVRTSNSAKRQRISTDSTGTTMKSISRSLMFYIVFSFQYIHN